MPGYVIHLAVGKVYIKNNEVKNIEEFEKGIIEPDMEEDKSKSHYGPYSSNPGLESYLNEQKVLDEYKEGYFLHLVTDYLFYNKFLKKWESVIYEDYDKLNSNIVNKYGIIIPKQVIQKVKFKEGTPELLDEKEIYKFINAVGSINIRKIIKENSKNIRTKLSKIEFQERD